ncbi:Spata5, partial [Acrasis kona]
MEVELIVHRFDPTQHERREVDRVGISVVESYAVISLPLSKLLKAEDCNDICVSTNGVLLRTYIDYSFDVVRKTFNPQNVKLEIYLTEYALKEVGCQPGEKITINGIKNYSQVRPWDQIILTPESKIPTSNFYVKHLLVNSLKIVKKIGVLNVCDLSLKGPVFIHFNVACRGHSEDYGVVTDKTSIVFNDPPSINPLALDISLSEQEITLYTMFKFALSEGNQINSTAKSFLLYGPYGVGKTFLVHDIANRLGAKIKTISHSDIYSRLFEADEGLINLTNIFKNLQSSPCIMLFDHIELLMP